MDDLQTDTLSDYGKERNQENLDNSKDNENACAASLLNGCDDLDPLDLMDHCENASIGSNSDVWKGSDSEDESFENKDTSENVKLQEKGAEDKKNEEPINESKEEGCDTQNQPKPKDKVEDASVVESEQLTQLCEEKDNAESCSKNKDEEKDQSESLLNGDNTEQNEITKKDDVLKDETEKKSSDDVNKDSSVIEPEASDKASQSDGEVTKQDSSKSDVQVTEQDPSKSDVEANKDPLLCDGNKDNTDKNEELRHNRGIEGQDEDCQMEYDADEDDDFDPSLLCPEVSMDVDESPVVTNNGPVPNDTGTDSPLPYEPVFSTFVDEVTGAEISFNLSAEEQELRKRLYGPINPVQLTRIHCTACNVHLGSALGGQSNRFVHPLLKVLICKECYHFYTSGEFEKDEDGSELYCRWCGQGGQVLCCSKCEFVFCKRCIRTNFGRKKMFEIRDSDSWDCFRCNLSQIITQRIACYEFFEYVRREMQRASTLGNNSDIWSLDYTRCCNQKKRPIQNGEESKKPKKRRSEVDPDYDPLADKPVVTDEPPTVGDPPTNNLGANKPIFLPKPIQILPRFTVKNKDNDIEFVRQIPAPQVTIAPTNRPAFRTILPQTRHLATQPTLVRISPQQMPPLLPTSSRFLGSALTARITSSSNLMKHEWFEKTVRAAARVNSHLSYTLTQLNKAQSQAGSVEELAVVHNKLQEILSSSINSLIQIRKNLRTEFIAGIKTVRLPCKKTTESFSNDDDVILVSAPTSMPMPSASQIAQPVKDPLIIIDKSNNTESSSAKISLKPVGPGGYLKVKSIKELQSVPSECITIPDDPPTSPSKKKEVEKKEEKEVEEKKEEEDPLNITVEVEPKDGGETVKGSDESKGSESDVIKNNNMSINVEEKLSPEMKRMMSVEVRVLRVDLEELQKKLHNKSQ